MLLTGMEPAPSSLPTVTEAISQLCAQQIILIYEPETRTLRATHARR
jgi:hypothetical protein